MARSPRNFGGDTVHEDSSWTYPLLIFFATIILIGLFLYYYFGPRFDELAGDAPKPTISDEPIELNVGGETFIIPANFTIYPRDRRSGERDRVMLYALWPNMSPYYPNRRTDFIEDTPNTRRIDMIIQNERPPLSEEERINLIYLPNTINQSGDIVQSDLRRYQFAEQVEGLTRNGYSGHELFVGETADGKRAAFLCQLERDGVSSPHCRRNMQLSDGVTLNYMFKRVHISQWRRIDESVQNLMATFQETRGD